MKLEYWKGKMAENDNQYTVDRQQVEEKTSFMLEPVRDKVVFCHYFNTFFNTFTILLKFLPRKRHLFPIFTL